MKKEVPLGEAPSGFGVEHLAGHEDGVDDVDDTVGLKDVGCGDDGHAALRVGEHDLAAGHGCCEIFALNGFEGGLAAALLDHAFQLLGADFAGDDMVGEDLVEGVFVLGLDERLDCARWELGEGLIGGGEDGEGAGAVEGVDQGRLP
jgi:hypothetical protein